jgi:hypothetical protein
MRRSYKVRAGVCLAWICLATVAIAMPPSLAVLLSPAEVQRLIPATFFYAGRSAPVQMRNAAGLRSQQGKVLLAALVDTSGYSSAIAEKYQGLLLTDGGLKLGGKPLGPGAYGLGSLADGDFVVTDLSGASVLSVPLLQDDGMRRPVPLQLREVEGRFRLYLGKKYVSVEFTDAR